MDVSANKTTGMIIAEERKKRGYTQESLAEAMGVSRQAVKDALQKGEKRLTEIENLLGLVQKIDTLERQIKTKN